MLGPVAAGDIGFDTFENRQPGVVWLVSELDQVICNRSVDPELASDTR